MIWKIDEKVRRRENINFGDQANQGTDQANQDIDQPNFSSSKNLVEYGKEEKAIVDLVLQDPRITQQDMALNLGWIPAKVKNYIAKLRQRKLITRNGSSQKGEWKILKNWFNEKRLQIFSTALNF